MISLCRNMFDVPLIESCLSLSHTHYLSSRSHNHHLSHSVSLSLSLPQSGDPACRSIWTLLCDISRLEFKRVYDALGVVVEEVGESFYNPYIPDTITRLQEAGLVEVEEGMLIIKLPHFVIPLIVRKSDGELSEIE